MGSETAAAGSSEPSGAGVEPYLTVSDAAGAMAFYAEAFGAAEMFRMMADDGKRILHATLAINGRSLMLSDEFPEFGPAGGPTPERLGGSPVSLHLQVADAAAANALFARAIAAGGKVLMPIEDQFWGDRFGKLTDPFGHVWSIGGPLPKQ